MVEENARFRIGKYISDHKHKANQIEITYEQKETAGICLIKFLLRI